MSSEQPGRTTRPTAGSPVGSTIAIVVTIVAVVLGFLILRRIDDDDDSGGSVTPATTIATTVSLDPTLTTVSTAPAVTVTTVFTPTVAGSSVQVANSSNQDRVAGALTTALAGEDFTTVDPTNGTTKLEATKILYVATDPAAQAVAQSVSILMGGVPLEAATTPVPTELGTLPAGVGVLVLLGNDKAGQTLAEMGEPATTESTVAGATTTSVATASP